MVNLLAIMKRSFYIFIICSVLFLFAVCAEAANVLNVGVYNESNDAPAGGVTFPGIAGLVLDGNLWIVSSQYIRVNYSSDSVQWAIRVITKNNADIGGVAPKIIGIDDPDGIHGSGDDSWEPGPDGVFNTADDVWGLGADGLAGTGDDTLVVTYAGLINPATKLDPNSRASLAWQVYRYNDPYYPDGVQHVPPLMPSPPPTVLNDGTVGGGPVDPWGYLADAGDSGYVLDPVNDYFWVAYGSGGFSLLAQHPVVYQDAGGNALPKPGGGDCLIYVGARFGRKGPDGVTDIGILPAGNYNTTIYLELIHW